MLLALLSCRALFKAKNYATAGVDIVASIEAPMNCEDQFKKKKRVRVTVDKGKLHILSAN